MYDDDEEDDATCWR